MRRVEDKGPKESYEDGNPTLDRMKILSIRDSPRRAAAKGLEPCSGEQITLVTHHQHTESMMIVPAEPSAMSHSLIDGGAVTILLIIELWLYLHVGTHGLGA